MKLTTVAFVLAAAVAWIWWGIRDALESVDGVHFYE